MTALNRRIVECPLTQNKKQMNVSGIGRPPNPMKKTTRLHVANSTAFTLVELLVVIAIIGGLAALAFPAIQRGMNAGRESKMISAMRQVVQANTLFSADNSGRIMALKWDGESTIEGGYVGGNFWGRLYPYLSGMPTVSNQEQLSDQIRKVLRSLYGEQAIKALRTDKGLDTMKGTPFFGPKIYGDTSGLPVPLAFNSYVRGGWNTWVTQAQVGKPGSTIYVTYGRATFSETNGAQYTPLPKNGAVGTSSIYFLPPNKTIAGFLDGGVRYITAPIPANMIKFEP